MQILQPSFDRFSLSMASTGCRHGATARPDRYIPDPGPSNDKLGVSKKGLSPLDLPPGLIRTVLASREPPRAQISIK